jgi:two-component system NtrC family response regulator
VPDRDESPKKPLGILLAICKVAMVRARILIVDPDAGVCSALASTFRRHNLDVAACGSPAKAILALNAFPPDALLARVEGPDDGGALLRELQARQCDAAVIVMVDPERVGAAVEAMRSGAESYLLTPVAPAQAAALLDRTLETRRLRREAVALRAQLRRRHTWVGASAGVKLAEEIVHRAGPITATVLVQGEAGTGRALVAQSLHELSPRRDRPFVRVSCAGRSDLLLESALFGQEPGAAPGVEQRRDGAIEAAHGGTLFLDEVGLLPPHLQIKLLRVLQHGEMERTGGRQVLRTDVRLVAATARDLASEVEAGRFRDDLYYRLDVVSIVLPPLRERREDIPALVEHFLATARRSDGKVVRSVSPGALSALFAYDWPGNVRELRSTLVQAARGCRGQELEVEDLPAVLRTGCEAHAGALIPGGTLFEIEREAILRALEETGGSSTRAAERLGISVRKIQYRLKEYRSGRLAGRPRSGGSATLAGLSS